MRDLYEELRHLVRSLNDARAEYALCGGLAMAVHGKVRATIDIDLLVPGEAIEQVKAVCRAQGFTREAKPMLMAEGRVPISRLTKASESGETISVDLLRVTDATQDAWRTRERLTWEGLELPVVSRDGLIALKQLRASGQDHDDIAWLKDH